MPSLDEVIITADLARRPSRSPDYEGENRALLGLMDCMAGRLAGDLASTERLQEISTELLGENQPGALYPKIVDAAALIMRSDFASIQVFHPDRDGDGALRLLAHRGFNPEAEHHWAWVNADSVSSCGASLRLRARVVVPDIEADELIAHSADLPIFRRLGVRAIQTTPLMARDGKLLGMLSTHWRRPHQPGERDLRLFDVLARQAADLIERSLSLHEMGTNAVKYGALSNREGRIEIDWNLTGAQAQGRFVLDWREKGGPPVAVPTRRGFGCSVTVRSIEHALDAEVDLAFAESGLTWTVVAPAVAVAERSRRLFETSRPAEVS